MWLDTRGQKQKSQVSLNTENTIKIKIQVFIYHINKNKKTTILKMARLEKMSIPKDKYWYNFFDSHLAIICQRYEMYITFDPAISERGNYSKI